MKKAISLKLFAILVLSLIVSFTPAVGLSQSSKAPIKIGCLYPFTGPLGFLGKFIKEGAIVAMDEINSSGGILGRKVEMIYRDTEIKPAKTVTFFKELVLKEKLPLIVGFGTGTEAFAVDTLIKESKVIVLNADSMEKEIDFNSNPHNFRLCMPTTPMAYAMADFVKKAGYKSVAISYLNTLFGTEARDDTIARLKELGIEPVLTDGHDMSETDFSPHALKIVGAKPDCVVIWSHNTLSAMNRALADLGWNGPFIGYSPPLVMKDYRALLPSVKLIDRTIYCMGYGKFGWPYNRPGMAHAEILVDEKLGEMYENIDVHIPLADYLKGYNVMRVIKFYIEKAGSLDSEKIKNALETYSFRAPLYDCNFKSGNHELSTDPKECYMGTFKNGWPILHEQEPKNVPLFEELRCQAQMETYKRADYKRGVTIRKFYRRWQELLKKDESKVRAQIADRKATVKEFTPDVAKLYEDTLNELLTTKF